MSDVKVLSIATIKFMSDGGITVGLSSVNGITAKRLDNVGSLLYNKLIELRSIERRKESARAAQRKSDEEKVNAGR